MRFGWVASVAGIALSSLGLGACSSGQTGSPDCVGPVSCVCDPLYGGGTLLRVHAESAGAGKLEAVVDEVFAPSDRAPNAQLGDRVGGSVLAERPCARGAPSTLQVGAELLVLYSAGVSRDPTQPRSAALLDGVFSFAIPWADTLSFGDSTQLASAELSVLFTPESCLERFPADPAPPCNDTPASAACSAAPRESGGGPGWFALLFGLGLLVRLRRAPAR